MNKNGESSNGAKDNGEPDLLTLATTIVAAYVSSHQLSEQGVSNLLESVHATLSDLADPDAARSKAPLEPAVPIASSVTDEVIYSLEDGHPYKSLKRHLRSKYNMTPMQYREKWGLEPDYPMVAPAYARRRSQLAKKSGLGKAPR